MYVFIYIYFFNLRVGNSFSVSTHPNIWYSTFQVWQDPDSRSASWAQKCPPSQINQMNNFRPLGTVCVLLSLSDSYTSFRVFPSFFFSKLVPAPSHRAYQLCLSSESCLPLLGILNQDPSRQGSCPTPTYCIQHGGGILKKTHQAGKMTSVFQFLLHLLRSVSCSEQNVTFWGAMLSVWNSSKWAELITTAHLLCEFKTNKVFILTPGKCR